METIPIREFEHWLSDGSGCRAVIKLDRQHFGERQIRTPARFSLVDDAERTAVELDQPAGDHGTVKLNGGDLRFIREAPSRDCEVHSARHQGNKKATSRREGEAPAEPQAAIRPPSIVSARQEPRPPEYRLWL